MKRAVIVAAALAAAALAAAPPTSAPGAALRVGVFAGNGSAASCVEDALAALRLDPEIEARTVTGAQIALGALDGLDVLVLPGGGGARQMGDLGQSGAAKVRAFAREEGKGVVGLCAGAYMLSDTPDYLCLRLCPARAVDREHDERGHGIIAFSLTQAGRGFFPELRGTAADFIYYYEGPLLVPEAEPAGFTVLATMETDVHLENGAPAGVLPGKPLFLTAESGKGRVFLSAGHPESTPGLRWIVPRAVRWAARRPSIPYTAAVVRPGLMAAPVLFDEALRKEESALLQKLLYGPEAEKCAAVSRLVQIRSWEGPRWIKGLLRDEEPSVRLCAARALVELERTWALPDVEAAVSAEASPALRAELAACAERLRAMAPSSAEKGGRGGRREIAITFDDLPLVNAGAQETEARLALSRKLVGAVRGAGVPAVGFVIGKHAETEEGRRILKVWLDAGLELGNHSQTHASLHDLGLEAYEKDVAAGDASLQALLAPFGLAPRYFRHPYLQTGRDAATKRELREFLGRLGYVAAPVTVDNSDWVFARAYAKALEAGDGEGARKVQEAYLPYLESKVDYYERESRSLLGYEVKQVLLLHASALNADSFAQTAAMLKRRGYAFVSLDEALRDPAYALPDGYAGGAGISWLHRWAFALEGKAGILPEEPRCPRWVMEAAGVDSE